MQWGAARFPEDAAGRVVQRTLMSYLSHKPVEVVVVLADIVVRQLVEQNLSDGQYLRYRRRPGPRRKEKSTRDKNQKAQEHRYSRQEN